MKSRFRRPVGELPQAFGVADPEVAFPPDGKYWHQHSGDRAIERQFHEHCRFAEELVGGRPGEKQNRPPPSHAKLRGLANPQV